MHDLTHSSTKLHEAHARGILFCGAPTQQSLQAQACTVAGMFGMARAAGFLGAKASPQLLPSTHTPALDGLELTFEWLDAAQHASMFPETVLQRSGIVVTGQAKSIGRAGIDMQILTAVTVAILELYNSLRVQDAQLEIGQVRLLDLPAQRHRKGKYFATPPICAVLSCSDEKAAGRRPDTSGLLARQLLEEAGAHVAHYTLLPDDRRQLQQQIKAWVHEGVGFIFTTGGTGLGPQHTAVAAVEELLDKRADGIVAAMRSHGQERSPLAMMSQGVAGVIGSTLVVTLPGSSNGVRESLEAILPAVFQARNMVRKRAKPYLLSKL
ncbi:molybdenum cofactor synthesis domain-containing protein [Pontibacter sp. CAU 1760]